MAGADDDTHSEARAMERRDDDAETEEGSIDLRNYLREDILEVVDECLHEWDKDKAAGVVGSSYVDTLHRCVVCTLPHGTCQHSQKWLESRHDHFILGHLPKDNVDLAMDDLSDVLQQAPVDLPHSNDQSLPPAMSNLHWETLCPQPADEISGTKVDLSSPASRAGHTMVLLNGTGSLVEDTRLLIVFGGVSRASREPWQQDSGAKGIEYANGSSDRRNDHQEQALSYHPDVRIFRVGISTWHKPETIGDTPEGRYGHVSLALDSDLMWMFGGRLQGGRQDGDTYLLDVRQMCWENTNDTRHGRRGPAARVWSAGVKVRERVLLFGGADIRSGRILDDVWAWDVATRTWTEHIVVGTPPLARYGHALLACSDKQVVVLGGCCVSSTAENGLPPDYDRMQLRVRVAADNVNRAHKLEEAHLAVGALANFFELGGVSWPIGCTVNHDRRARCSDPLGKVPAERARWRDLSRGQALFAAAVAARERDTALQEKKLRAVLYETAASSYWAKLQSRHPIEHLDAAFLDTDSMIWGANVSQQSSRSTRRDAVYTAAPAARMHFSAATINEKVIVWGGCLPTAKRMQPVDGGVYVFDVVNRRWSRPAGGQHPDGIRPRMDAAVGQVRRAARSLFEAKQRAMTMGAPAGRTMQVLQAEAVLEVNRWRVQRLVEEIRRAVPSPPPRAAHAGSAVGHRIMYFGGWGAEAAGNGEMLVLDVEQPREKQRRLEDEFHLRLELERQARDQAEGELLRRTARQEKMRKALEMASEAAETKGMAAEDARSAIPELTVAPPPRLRCRNSTTLWLEWDRPTVDAVGKHPADRVEYTLYMRGGFREWEVGDRVLVDCMSKAARKAAASVSTVATTATTGHHSVTYSDLSAGGRLSGHSEMGRVGGNIGSTDVDHEGNDQEDGGDLDGVSPRQYQQQQQQQQMAEQRPKHVLMPAVITYASAGGGLYDIRWNDGEKEHGVNRCRIHRAVPPAPPWTIIYKGDDCRYAVEGMVPGAIIERERAFPYEVSAEFSLQTQGTEVPREKISRHSPLVTLSTCSRGQGPLDETREGGRGACVGAPVAALKARLVTAKALDDFISAGGVESRSLSAGINPQQGQCTGTGRGRLYL